jgi:Delta7-sterol 5-desaturase
MDIINEICDTFVGDYVYAWAVPARPAPYDYPSHNSSAEQVFSTWHYKPATKLFSLTPSSAAYMSAWDRDNIYRQAINVWLITWYVVPYPRL